MTQLDLVSNRPGDGVFQFPGTGDYIRTMLIDGEPWFIGRDICEVLSLANHRSSLALLDDDERAVHTVDAPSGQQEHVIVSEPGMYSLVLRSRRPEAKAFKRWITHEVLPAIRKTGRYETAEPDELEVAERYLAAVKAKRALEIKVAELEPRAAQADHYRAADTLVTISSFANDLQLWAKETHRVRILHEHVFDFMAELGLLIRGNTLRNNQPTANAIDRGLLRPKHTVIARTAGPEEKISARLTQKGVSYVWDKATARIAANGDLNPTTALEAAQ